MNERPDHLQNTDQNSSNLLPSETKTDIAACQHAIEMSLVKWGCELKAALVYLNGDVDFEIDPDYQISIYVAKSPDEIQER